jgi:hypothetical protein
MRTEDLCTQKSVDRSELRTFATVGGDGGGPLESPWRFSPLPGAIKWKASVESDVDNFIWG